MGAGIKSLRIFCWETCQKHRDPAMVGLGDMEAPNLWKSLPTRADMFYHGQLPVEARVQGHHTSWATEQGSKTLLTLYTGPNIGAGGEFPVHGTKISMY